MLCPKCKNRDTKVLDSRETDGYKAVRRRRECETCEYRFTTFERIETNKFLVVKRDGVRENYDREKLEKGIWIACQKRKVTEQQISSMLDELEEAWSALGKEVSSKVIGDNVMDALKDIDEVAYIRFVSVCRQFKDLESFKKELDSLKGK
ncbi:transcriptional regulator NrdR [Candidatus Peregrinibacteria bacterium CG10_big_fil_rev_8_21_14_0_10_36_19]|nr:MAG: transcriptional regulator NrdR [Candidatus Peregrinibacteria bacterium CG10_big_fil_rev_8_21_14_0_10_36_19]